MRLSLIVAVSLCVGACLGFAAAMLSSSPVERVVRDVARPVVQVTTDAIQDARGREEALAAALNQAQVCAEQLGIEQHKNGVLTLAAARNAAQQIATTKAETAARDVLAFEDEDYQRWAVEPLPAGLRRLRANADCAHRSDANRANTTGVNCANP